MSKLLRWVVIIAIVAVASFVVGIAFGKYTEQEGAGLVSAPAYDSGWIVPNINEETIIEHNLGTTEVLVYITGKDDEWAIHQYSYGGDWTALGNRRGAMWYNLTSSHVTLWVHAEEFRWDYVRIQIWKIQEPTS